MVSFLHSGSRGWTNLITSGELLCVSSKLAALDRPSTFEKMSVQNFFHNKKPLVRHENYIGNTTDLITLKGERDDAWLDRQILRLLVRANNRVLSVSLAIHPHIPFNQLWNF